MRAALHFPFLFLLPWACVPAQQEALPTTPATTPAADTVVDTALVYRTAIGDYIGAMTKRDGSFPDTLFINRHEEFPAIELPGLIEHTTIRVLAPSEAETVKDREHFVCLNIFGWFNPNAVEFHVINFRQDWRHRPDGRDDCHLYYNIGSTGNEYVLDSLRF